MYTLSGITDRQIVPDMNAATRRDELRPPQRAEQQATKTEAVPQDKGDTVSVSQAAKELFAAARQNGDTSFADKQHPHAVMTGMTAQGTKVKVEAVSLERTVFTMNGAQSHSVLDGAGRKNGLASLFNQNGKPTGGPQEMLYTATFTHANGKVQEFQLGGNAMFREEKDGSIHMDSSPQKEKTLVGTEADEIFIAIEDGTEVLAGNGNNRIFNMAQQSRIISGEGSDLIASMGTGARIDAGEGDDAIVLLQDTLRPETSESLAQSEADSPENRREDQRPHGAQRLDVDAGNGNNDVLADVDLYQSSIRSGNGTDNISLRSATSTLISLGEGNDTLKGEDLFFSSIDAGGGNDNLSLHNVYGGRVSGGDGDDVIEADKLFDTVIGGGNGDDVIRVDEATNSAIGGGAGNDVILVNTLINSAVNGGEGDDTISVGSSVNSLITGGAGNNSIRVENQSSGFTITTESGQPGTADGLLQESIPEAIVAVGPGGTRRVVSTTNGKNAD